MKWISLSVGTDIKTYLFDKQYLKQFKYRIPHRKIRKEFAFPHNNKWDMNKINDAITMRKDEVE